MLITQLLTSTPYLILINKHIWLNLIYRVELNIGGLPTKITLV